MSGFMRRGQVLDTLIEVREMTPNQFAERVGLHPSTISRARRELKPLSAQNGLKIAEALAPLSENEVRLLADACGIEPSRLARFLVPASEIRGEPGQLLAELQALLPPMKFRRLVQAIHDAVMHVATLSPEEAEYLRRRAIESRMRSSAPPDG